MQVCINIDWYFVLVLVMISDSDKYSKHVDPNELSDLQSSRVPSLMKYVDMKIVPNTRL